MLKKYPLHIQKKATQRANGIPFNQLTIVYECACDWIPGYKKLKHHFDYEYEEAVMLLCNRCHWEEHKKLNRIRKFYNHEK